MSLVSVSFGLRTIKLKATPSTPLNELLERSIVHFKLNATVSYGLFYQSTKLSNLPFRLLGLPQGAKLTLEKAASTPNLIQIKINVFNNPQNDRSSIVKKVMSSTSLKELLQELEKDLGFSIIGTSYKVKLQTMSGVIENLDSSFTNFGKTTLRTFGLDNNSLLRLTFVQQTVIKKETKPTPMNTQLNPIYTDEDANNKPHPNEVEQQQSPMPQSEPTTPTVDNTPEPTILDKRTLEVSEPKLTVVNEPIEHNSQIENKETTSMKMAKDDDGDVPMVDTAEMDNESLNIKVYKVGDQQIKHYEPSDAVYNMTVPQLKQYQQMLSNKANENPKLAALRKAKLQKQKQANLKKVGVRIKFPNLFFVDFNISSEKTKKELYVYVSQTFLKNATLKFELYTPHPFTLVDKSEEKLLDSFEARNLLLFQEDSGTTDLLRDEYMKNVKDINETEAVKLDNDRLSIPDDDKEESLDDTSKFTREQVNSNKPHDKNDPKILSKESKLKNLLRLGKK